MSTTPRRARPGKFLPDTRHGAKLGDGALRALRRIGPLTFMAVSPHSGRRIASIATSTVCSTATAEEFHRKIRSAGARETDYNAGMHARSHAPAAHAQSNERIAERAAAIDDGIASRVAAIDAIAERVAAIDDAVVARELDAQGFCTVEHLLAPAACDALAALYPRDDLFRSRVVMASHGFGRGEYKYFAYPLPELVARLRTRLYPHLVAIANRWSTELGLDVRYPDDHAGFVARCHAAGQLRPTPLLLAYAEGDYNCLHQDLYGEHVFPLQVAILLSAPDRDFTGGEFVMTEQRPRMQSRPMVVPLHKGDAVVFAVHHRPVHGTRGVYRVNLRHGVSRVRSGSRHTLGIIFHDAS